MIEVDNFFKLTEANYRAGRWPRHFKDESEVTPHREPYRGITSGYVPWPAPPLQLVICKRCGNFSLVGHHHCLIPPEKPKPKPEPEPKKIKITRADGSKKLPKGPWDHLFEKKLRKPIRCSFCWEKARYIAQRQGVNTKRYACERHKRELDAWVKRYNDRLLRNQSVWG